MAWWNPETLKDEEVENKKKVKPDLYDMFDIPKPSEADEKKSLVGEEDEDASFCEGEDVGVEAERSRWIIKIESEIQELEAEREYSGESKCRKIGHQLEVLRGLLEKKEEKK